MYFRVNSAMSFTYDFTTQPLLSQVRLLAADTTPPGIFQDDEVNQAITLESSQGLYVSGQANPLGTNLNYVPLIYSVRRSAAMLLDVMASKLSRLAAIESLLDVKQKCEAAAQECAKRADSLRQQEADLGSFAIAEMVNDQFSARERVYAQLLRVEGS